jgi:signal transduction histidine kinase
VALAFLPLGLLAGLVRGRLDRTAVADLAVALTGPAGHQGLRAALAQAVHDPSLDVVYWIAERQEFLDGDGTSVRLDGRPPSATTVLQRDGQPVAALLHDEVVGEQRALLEAVAATAGLAIENERLHAEVRAQLAEVRASRARIVAAAAAERRRVERNLHDGAQQSLLSVLLALRLVQAQLDAGSSDAARESLHDACKALTAALDEVRELARGIHPAVLSDAGLADALRALAERSPVPVELSAVPPGRLPSLVEETAYYVVAESLANVVKHARATRAVVDLRLRQGRLLVQVRDDGAGGAEPARGSGLRGLVDRVAAVDGHLDVDSTSSGTRVQAEIPCG